MIRHVGRAQMIGIAAVLAVFFITELAMPPGAATQRRQQTQVALR